MRDDLFAACQRAALQRWVELVEWRDRAQRELESTHAATRAEAQQAYDTQREAIERTFQEATADADATRDEKIAAIESSFQREHGRLQTEYRERRESIRIKAEINEKQAATLLEEAVWLAESVYEGTIERPDEVYEQTRRDLQKQLEALGRVEERLRETLGRVWLSLPVVDEAEVNVGEPDDAAAAIAERCDAAREAVERLRAMRSRRLLGSPVLVVLLVLLAAGGAVAGAWRSGWTMSSLVVAGGLAGLGAWMVVMAGAYLFARSRAKSTAGPIVHDVAAARALYDVALQQTAAWREQEKRVITQRRDQELAEAKAKHGPIIERVHERRDHHLRELDQHYPPRLEEMKAARDRELAAVQAGHDANTAEARQARDEALAALDREHGERVEALQAAEQAAWDDFLRTWREGVEAVATVANEVRQRGAASFPDWHDPLFDDWTPPHEFIPAVRVGEVEVDSASLPGGLPEDDRLPVRGLERLVLPATLSFPDRCSLIVRSDADGRERAIATLQTAMLRLLTGLPPGKVRFTIIDPVGLGENFAGFMHLADYDENFVGRKIWTEPRHIEQRLADLTEHMENVIQKYLRNEFSTIAEYNERAGEIAEPYRFLVLADFPTNVSESAAQRLTSIITSGARCGVYVLMSVDARQSLPKGFELDDLRPHFTTFEHHDGRFVWRDDAYENFPLTLDEMPSPERVTSALRKVGEASKDATRVEVPFTNIAPGDGRCWTGETREAVHVPLGRAGATKHQLLTLGRGTQQHALIAGKTGSGKSNLLHVLITNLALWYSPDEVEFYLVDFKKGVEFKAYARHNLPHARAIAIESDREFGLSVLQRLDAELKRRGNVFRELGVQNLAGFRDAVDAGRGTDAGPIPRTLLIIDEFQEFFTEDDKIAQDAALLLDRLVRQGRAFGIHVLLGSQTLAGAYSLNRATMGQMGVRVALQCSEADSYLILNEDNAAARLLGRPGEAIYNDSSGTVEGNSPFQVAFLPDAERERQLRHVEALVAAQPQRAAHAEPPIVFEGSAPALLSRNRPLSAALRAEAATTVPGAPLAWLGDAVAIKDPTAARFSRQSGSNLLIVGQREEQALAMMASSLISLAAQHGPEGATFYIFDGTPADAVFAGHLQRIADLLPHEVTVVAWRDVEDVVVELGREVEGRQEANATDAPAVYALINGLHRFRKLRTTDDLYSFSMSDEPKPPSADKALTTLITEGPTFGMHLLAWCDTLTNLERTLDRKTMREFEQRVLFQMSATDSSNLIDTPLASKLGMHRAIFHSEEQGLVEKFRPYALPDEAFLERLAGHFSARIAL